MEVNTKVFGYLLMITTGCAQIVAPTGGPKDELGPKVISISPIDKTVKFPLVKQEIKIRFDEFIQLKDPTKQIIMSPPLKERTEYIINGKELNIRFKEELIKNTTYTINFGNAVVDNHEGIASQNLQYTFSTGEHIDSNFIKGKVRNGFTNFASQGVIVALYKKSTFTDTTLFKLNPTYFTKSKADGNFIIENMPADQFILYAYKKDGIDLKYAKNDSIAINNLTVNTEVGNRNFDLFLFKPNEYKTDKIFDTSSYQVGVYNFAIYKPKETKITTTNNEKVFYKTIKGLSGIDTIKLFIEDNKDSCKFKITNLDTSFYVTIKSKKKSKKPEFLLYSKVDLSPIDTLIIESTVPIKNIIKDSIIFKEDTLVIKPLLFEIQDNRMKFKLLNNWKEATNYTITFKDSSLQDIYGKYNKVSTYNINIKAFKEYGNLFLKVELANAKHNYILQLLNNATSEVIKEYVITKDTSLSILYLNPMEGKIKVIEDMNNNGLWDNGDLENMILPERVFNDKQHLNIRAYWDIEQTININDIINQQ